MSTVYSLIAWGGRTGKTVSLSASTDVVTLTNHGLRNGTKLWPSGTLPAELSVLIPVYARWTAENTFTLHTSSAGAIANTGQITFAGSSTYAAVVLKSDLIASVGHSALAPYGLSDLSRWGSSGSERIYDGLQNCLTARTPAASMIVGEHFEIGDAFDETYNGSCAPATRAPSLVIETKINGVRTPAFHGGVVSGGYRYISLNVAGTYTPNQYNLIADGIEFNAASNGSGGYYAVEPGALAAYITIRNCIIRRTGTGSYFGVKFGNFAFYNNIVMGFTVAAYPAMNILTSGSYIYNNLVTKNNVGFKASDTTHGLYFNNISIGNTSNWQQSGSYQATRCIGNIGDATADKVAFTATAASTTLVCASAPLQNVNSIVFLKTTGTLPTVAGVPLSTSVGYYIRSVSGNNITIGLTYNGTALTFDGVGTGTHYLNLVWSSVQPVSAEIDFTTPDNVFQDYANNDFRPAGTGATPHASAVQVDSAVDIFVDLLYDIADKERPQYRNGAAEYKDAGPFEYDFGYTRPATHVLTLDNVVVGARVFIRDEADTVTHYDQIAASSTVVITATVYGDSRDNWRIKVRKASAAPFYQPYETLMTATPGSSSIYVSQIPDE